MTASAAIWGTLGLLATISSTGCTCPSGGPSCGNGVREDTEVCDGSDLGLVTCAGYGFDTGAPFCRDDCTPDVSACSRCGDGAATGVESCDGLDLGGASCTSLGWDGGSLACLTGCMLDDTACYGCGDGAVGGDEECDGPELLTESCVSLGFESGTLGCGLDCMFDTSQCMAFNPSALEFDGVDDIVGCGVIPIGADVYSFTWEAWLDISPSSPSPGTIISKWFDTAIPVSPARTLRAYFQDAQLWLAMERCNMSLSGCADAFQPVAPYVGAWHHYAIVFDCTGGPFQYGSIFVDGVLVAQGDGALSCTLSLADGPAPVYIGDEEWSAAGSPYAGAIDEIRLWSYARTGAEIAADMNSRLTGTEPNLVWYFPLDEGAGQSTVEVVNGATCTLGGLTTADGRDPTWTSTTPF